MENNNEKRKKLIARYEQLLEKVHHDLKNELFALGLTVELLKVAPQEAVTRFPLLLDNLDNNFQKMKTLIHELMQAQSS